MLLIFTLVPHIKGFLCWLKEQRFDLIDLIVSLLGMRLSCSNVNIEHYAFEQ